MPDGSGAVIIGGVPQTWQAALAMLAESLADRFRADQAERSREIGALNQEVDDLRTLVTQLTNRLGEADKARDELAGEVIALQCGARDMSDTVDQVAGQVQDVKRDVTAAGEAHAALVKARDELAGQVENQTRQVDEALADVRGLAQQAIKGGEANAQALTAAGESAARQAQTLQELQPLAGRVDELAARVDQYDQAAGETHQALADVRSLADQAVRGAETNGEAVAALTQRVDRTDALQADHAKVTAATDAACSSLRDQVDEIRGAQGELVQSVQKVAATAGEQVDEIVKAVTATSTLRDQVDTTLRQVHATMANQAAGFLIDQAGHLVAIRNNGEQVDLGQVVGANGRDGAAPIELVAVAQEGDQVRFIMSDGKEHRSRLTQSPEPVTIPQEPKYNGHSVADMVTMRANGLTFEKIGQLCGITGQYAARLIKKAGGNGGGNSGAKQTKALRN